MSALKCMIVDDEPLACRLLSSYVERTDSLTLAGSFTSASRGLEAINSVVPDIAFLDIQMPEMSGIELAGRITAAGTRVVFTTAYPDFALEGFRVNALHYLLKPISYSEFLEAVGRAAVLRPQSGEERYITVKSEYRLIRICVSDILYIEGLKDYIKIYTDGEPRPVLTLMSMKAVEACSRRRTSCVSIARISPIPAVYAFSSRDASSTAMRAFRFLTHAARC